MQTPLAKPNIELVKSNISYYQREEDNFFCLSDACNDLAISHNKFFKLQEVKLTIAWLFPNRTPPKSNTLANLAQTYPEIISYSKKSNTLDGGIWIDSIFIEIFEQWTRQLSGKSWLQQVETKQNKFLLGFTESKNSWQFLLDLQTKDILIDSKLIDLFSFRPDTDKGFPEINDMNCD